MKNHYQTLGVSPSATAEEIKSAFKRLSIKVHPDKNWGEKIFEELFKNVNEAYQVLGNEEERRAYNQKYNHFFFSNSQQTIRPQADENSRLFQPRKTNLLRKFFINGLGSLLLVFFFMGVNAFMFTNDEIQNVSITDELPISSSPIEKNKTIKDKSSSLVIKKSPGLILPVEKEKTENNLNIITKNTNAPFKIKEEASISYPDEIKKTTLKMNWTEMEMQEIVQKVNVFKREKRSTSNCIRLLQSSNSNIENGFGLANYLQGNHYSIAGRLSTSQNSNGVLMELDNNKCIVITIGFIK